MDITKSIYDNFAAVAERRGDHTAVFFLGTRYSYNEIRSSADSFAAALTDMGVTAGHKVMLYIPNSIHWVVTWLGIQKIGAVGVPITPIYTPHDLAYIAEDSQAETIICADTNFGYVTSVLATTGLKRVVVSNVADLLPWWKRYFGLLFDIIPRGKYLLDARTFSLRKLLAQHRNPSSQSTGNGAGGRAPAEILYTGGTTKFPKGVPFTHDLFLVSADEQIRMSEPLIPVEDNVIMGNAPPVSHSGPNLQSGHPADGGQFDSAAAHQHRCHLRFHSARRSENHDRCARPVPHDIGACPPGTI